MQQLDSSDEESNNNFALSKKGTKEKTAILFGPSKVATSYIDM